MKKIWIKDNLLSSELEHIYRAIYSIKKRRLDLLSPSSVIIDVGAANGTVSKVLAENFPQRKLFAYDPVEYKNRYENKNLEWKSVLLSEIAGVTQFNVAQNKVSSSINDIDMSSPEFSKNFEIENRIELKTSTLDFEFPKEEVLILKLDTQGHDLKVLKGGMSLLKRTHCVITEMMNHDTYINGSHYFDTDRFLRQSGFTLTDISVFKRKNGITVTEYDAIYFKRE